MIYLNSYRAANVSCAHKTLKIYPILFLNLARASSFTRFLDHTQRHIIVGWTPLEEEFARRKDLYLTTHNTHNIHTFMPPVGFEPTISAGERPQTYALDREATGTGTQYY